MKWFKDNIMGIISLLVATIGVGALAFYEEAQAMKRKADMEAIFVDPVTLEPTAWARMHMIEPAKDEFKKEVESVFMDKAKLAVLANLLEIDIEELGKNNEMATDLRRRLDSAGVEFDDVITMMATMNNETNADACDFIRGVYRMDKCTKEYTHYFTPRGGWNKLYHSINPQYNGEYCEPFWWHLNAEGKVKINREISRMVKCP